MKKNKPETNIRDGDNVEFTRVASIESIDEGSRTIQISFSSEEPVVRSSWFDDDWVEVLSHDDGDVDLERINVVGPLLFNHSRYERLGVVVPGTARIENKRGLATVRFSTRDDDSLSGIWHDVKDKILTGVSVGYSVTKKTLVYEKEGENSVYRCSWRAHEISIVDMPADITVGIGRSKSRVTKGNVEAIKAKGGFEMGVSRSELKKENKSRIEGIKSLLEPHVSTHAWVSGLMSKSIEDMDCTVENVRSLFMTELEKSGRVDPVQNLIVESAGDTHQQGRITDMEDAIAIRVGLKENDNKNDLATFSLSELSRTCLSWAGGNSRGMSKIEMVGRSFVQRSTIGHSTSDFPLILQNVANKVLLKGYRGLSEHDDLISYKGSLSDFKSAMRLSLGEVSELGKMPEGGEYPSLTALEDGQQISLSTYGGIIGLSRVMVINDDIDALQRIPKKRGQAARRTVANAVWRVITDNLAMSDGSALFSVAHNNVSQTPAVINSGSISEGVAAMMLQKDVSGVVASGLKPKYLVVPVALMDAANTFISSSSLPGQTNSGVKNIYHNNFEVIVEPRLDAVSTTSWYLIADPVEGEGIERAFLDGVESPFLDIHTPWDTDGVQYKVRIDSGAAAINYRAMYQNPGV